MRNIKVYNRPVSPTVLKFRPVQMKNNIEIDLVVADFTTTEIETVFTSQSTVKESLAVQVENI